MAPTWAVPGLLYIHFEWAMDFNESGSAIWPSGQRAFPGLVTSGSTWARVPH